MVKFTPPLLRARVAACWGFCWRHAVCAFCGRSSRVGGVVVYGIEPIERKVDECLVGVLHLWCVALWAG